MVMLMVVSLFAGISIPNASASEVVMTDAIEVTPDGAFSDRMVSVDADSQGNTHFVWSRNTQHLYYKMLDPRGEVLIDDTKISNADTEPGTQIPESTTMTWCTSRGPTKRDNGR